MNTKGIIKRARGFAKPFRVTDGTGFRLKDVDPGDTLQFGSEDKPRAKEALAIGIETLAELQDMLYAQDRWAVLLVFQAMDAAGKDGTIIRFSALIGSPAVDSSMMWSKSRRRLGAIASLRFRPAPAFRSRPSAGGRTGPCALSS
jgi:hypothetical protein